MYKVKLFVMTNLFMFGIIFSQDGWEHQWWGTKIFGRFRQAVTQ